MAKQLLIFVFSSLLFFCADAQKKTSSSPKTATIYQTLQGRWRAEDDKRVVLIFDGKKYTELYRKDTTDILEYILSSSCKVLDEVKDSVYLLDKNKSLKVLLYKKGESQRCYELLTVTKKNISWMSEANGKIFVFIRIASASLPKTSRTHLPDRKK